MATRSASRAARRAMSLRLIICSGLTVAVTAEGGHGWPRAAAEAGGDLLVNGQGGAEHDDAPRGVLQLTDVARPVILEEDAHGVSRDFDFASVLEGELGEEMTDEHRDLLAPLAQRGDPDLEDVQAVVQIFPELMGLHRGLEV